MEYREIQARSFDEARFKIRQEYGDRARIISKEESLKGGFLGFGRKKVVKIRFSILDKDFQQALGEKVESYKEKMGIKNHFSSNSKIKKNTTLNDVDNGSNSILIGDIFEKLNNIESKMQGSADNQDEGLHSNIIEIKQILKENEFYDDFIDRVVNDIKENLSYSRIDDRIEVHKFVYNYIKEKLNISDNFKKNSDRKKILILVGPTGVGKTTTIAKIAANAIKEKIKVQLITIDGYRIGAKYQLEKYAEYMKTPISAVEDNKDLQKIVDLSDADLILIDTIGRSARDEMKLVEMKQILKVERFDPEYVLTLCASVKSKEVKKIFKNFDIFEYNSIIITKTDESETIGAILNSAIEKGRGIKYFTDGQKVPNDIEKANHTNLMEKIKGLDIEVYLDSVKC